MVGHWHLYCDEAGTFEEMGKWKKSIILGMLVPEDKREDLIQEYNELYKKNKLDDILKKNGLSPHFVHGKDIYKEQQFQSFSKDLIQVTLKSSIPLCRITYGQDILNGAGDTCSEVFAANRYLYMIQAMIEHILYLHPKAYGYDIDFSFHPNSRVFPYDPSEELRLEELGFYLLKIENGPRLANVWNIDALRVFLNRLGQFYAPYLPVTGKRGIMGIEMPVARNSEDPFVQWVDVLAGAIMWQDQSSIAGELRSSLLIDLSYEFKEDIFKHLCHLCLQKKPKEFIIQYISHAGEFRDSYYRDQSALMLEKELKELGKSSAKEIFELEALADEHLRSSSGDWQFVSTIIEYLIRAIKEMPEEKVKKESLQKTLLRLYNHKLSYLNHRGEFLPALEVVKKVRNLQADPVTLEDWRQDIEFKNRQAVTAANLFAFDYGNKRLLPLVNGLEETISLAGRYAGHKLKDPLVGKLKGTIAQNYAFMARLSPELFVKAEELFLNARARFDRPEDILRQNTYLAHLYMDRQRMDKVIEIYGDIIKDRSVAAFLERPCAETSRYMQYTLSLILKLYLYINKPEISLLKTYNPQNLKDWFGSSSLEHPFGLINAYLGRMALLLRADQATIDLFFKRALSIPSEGEKTRQITIRAIRAEILVWWGLGLSKMNRQEKAHEKLTRALDIMHTIGEEKELSLILRLEGNRAVSGWFSDGYNRLAETVESSKVDPDACKTFLRCFTFNYC